MRRVDSLEKTLMLGGMGAGGEGDDRGWDGWMASLSMDVSLSELRELVMDREAWHAAIHGVAKNRTQLSHWTELNWTKSVSSSINWEQHFLPKRIVIKSKAKNIFFIKKRQVSLPWGPAKFFVNYSSVVQVLKINQKCLLISYLFMGYWCSCHIILNKEKVQNYLKFDWVKKCILEWFVHSISKQDKAISR